MDNIKFEPIPDYADVFDLEEWDSVRACGGIIPNDGCGFWCKGGQESTVDCFATRPDWATHVAWYNN